MRWSRPTWPSVWPPPGPSRARAAERALLGSATPVSVDPIDVELVDGSSPSWTPWPARPLVPRALHAPFPAACRLPLRIAPEPWAEGSRVDEPGIPDVRFEAIAVGRASCVPAVLDGGHRVGLVEGVSRRGSLGGGAGRRGASISDPRRGGGDHGETARTRERGRLLRPAVARAWDAPAVPALFRMGGLGLDRAPGRLRSRV